VNAVLKQISKFASVGAVATVIHVAVTLMLNSVFSISALTANFMAFVVASIFSYFGNWLWTFEKAGTLSRSLPRFAFLNLGCFAVNQSIVYIVVSLMHLPLAVAMVPVVATIPAFSFWLSKSKVFIQA
jgi:putative flippase GtrA